MKDNIFLAIAAIGVILVSGCVQTTPSALAGTGLAITDFSSSAEEIEGKDRNVRVALEVENQGGSPTANILACLVGSNFPGETSEQMWKNESVICQKATRTLQAADFVNNIAGGAARFSWTLKSPWIPYPMTRQDEFTGRVFYEYATKASAIVWVYSEDEIKSAKQRGESVPTTLVVIKTAAPVDISLNTIQPVKSEDGYFTLKITVSNVGGGTVFNHTNFAWNSATTPSLTDILNQVKLTYSYPSDLKPEACDSEIELKKGDTKTISCDFTLKKSVTAKQSYPVTVSASYGYYIDKTVSIKVVGKKGQSAT